MSKVKQWAWDTAEKAVDKILDDFKSGKYNSTVAKNKITMVDNLFTASSYFISFLTYWSMILSDCFSASSR